MEPNIESNPPQTPPLVEKPIESQPIQEPDLVIPEPINFKKYIIAVIVGVAFLGSIFIGYVFFFKNANHETADTTTQNSELENTLSTEANEEPKSELEIVVNEIKGEQDNDSTPPGITITIPDESQPEDSTTPDTTEATTKIPR